jgi:hypothetical protein
MARSPRSNALICCSTSSLLIVRVALPSSDECKRRLRIRASIALSNGAEINLKDLRPLRDDFQTKADGCARLPAEALLRVARFLCDEQVRATLKAHVDKHVIAGMLAVTPPERVAQYLLKRSNFPTSGRPRV